MAKEKKFDLAEFKKQIKASDTPLKKDVFVVLDDCLHATLGMPGLALGHITQVFGKSDTGKTSLLFHAAAQCQKQGIIPVVIVTEGKVDWDRAAAMGFNREEAIVEEDLEYLEDVFTYIDLIISKVSNGELPKDVMIFWDSLANTLSRDEVEVKDDGTTVKKSTMMKAAKVVSENLRVISKKINNTRKISSPKTVGLLVVNACYTKPPEFPGGRPGLVPYGGDALWYKSSLVIRTNRIQKLIAAKGGQKLGFGIVTKISVDKNHITNVSHSGTFIITADAIIPNQKKALDVYKAEHKDGWGDVVAMSDAGDVISQEIDDESED